MFYEIAKVSDCVDQRVIGRTVEWLLGRRELGKFVLARGRYAFANPPEKTANGALKIREKITLIILAYILWALTRFGVKGLNEEIETALESAKGSKDM